MQATVTASVTDAGPRHKNGSLKIKLCPWCRYLIIRTSNLGCVRADCH